MWLVLYILNDILVIDRDEKFLLVYLCCTNIIKVTQVQLSSCKNVLKAIFLCAFTCIVPLSEACVHLAPTLVDDYRAFCKYKTH